MLRVGLNVCGVPGVEGGVGSGAVHELVVLLLPVGLLLLPSEGVLVGGVGALGEVVLLELVALIAGTC